MLYKNVSYTVKTFYGVKFNPGDTKEVNGVINDKWMVLVDSEHSSSTHQNKISPETLRNDSQNDDTTTSKSKGTKVVKQETKPDNETNVDGDASGKK